VKLARALCVAGSLALASQAAEPGRYFAPPHAEGAALSPDGRHLAYFRWAGDRKTEVVIVDCEHPSSVSDAVLPQRPRSTAAEQQVLRWVNASTLAIRTRTGATWSMNVGGKTAPLDGIPFPPPRLEQPSDHRLVTSQVQSLLNYEFPERGVDIAGWDDAQRRALLLVTSREEPGRYFLYDRNLDQLTECVRLAPQLTRADLAAVRIYSVRTGVASRAQLLVAQPNRGTSARLPVVVLCRAMSQIQLPRFEPELHCLVAAGFAVVEFSGELGSPNATEPQHEALAVLLDHLPLDASRVAVLGLERGAVVAAKLLAEHPRQFRCGAMIDAPFALPRSDPVPILRTRTEGGKRAAAFVQFIAFAREKL
jgi:hypothetical protein